MRLHLMDWISELREEVMAGNNERAVSLIEQDPSLLGVRFPGNFTPLQQAAFNGNRPLADRLLQMGALLDIVAAVFLGRTDDVRRFLDQKPLLIQKHSPWGGLSLLHLAAHYGDLELLRLLLTRGLDANESRNCARVTPLFWAGRAPYKNAEMLLAQGANINARSKDGFTVLHFAARGEDERWVEFLLSRGAEAEAQTNARQTPWELAVKSRHHRIADILSRAAQTRSKPL